MKVLIEDNLLPWLGATMAKALDLPDIDGMAYCD